MRYYTTDNNMRVTFIRCLPAHLSRYRILHSKMHYGIGRWGEYISQEDMSEGFGYIQNHFHLNKKVSFGVGGAVPVTGIVYILKGSLILRSSVRNETLSAGHCYVCYLPLGKFDFVFPPGNQYWFLLKIRKSYIRSLSEKFEKVTQLLKQASDAPNNIHTVIAGGITKMSKQLIFDICSNKEKSPERELRLGAYVRAMLASLSILLRKDIIGKPQKVEANSLADFVEQRLDGIITIATIAKAFAINETTVKRIFRKLFDKSVHSYILEKRLNYAAKLLITTSDSIYSIALKTGFTDSSHLVKRFKNRFMVTPVEYRKTNYNK